MSDTIITDRTAGTTAERIVVWLVVIAVVAALARFLGPTLM